MSSRGCSLSDCTSKHYARGFCSRHYQRLQKTGNPLSLKFRRGSSIEESFALHTRREGSCLVWVGGKDRGGEYGTVWHLGRTRRVHRVAWELANGNIPPGMFIDHMCHTPPCVEPTHLRLATRKQNMENLRGASAASATGIRGVFRAGPKFIAQVGHEGRTVHIGSFATADEAEVAVVAKRNELFTHNNADRKVS